ncbi:reductive dehalogenase [Lentibacter sp.]|uniref:reductive dehalogenase n=1 Tax=Lentibacter sp. TaxID=2024994 RepID=UPI003F6CBEE3
MGLRFFSDKKRPLHLGNYPLEKLARRDALPDLDGLTPRAALSYHRPDAPESIVNAMGEFAAMLDAIRDGFVNKAQAGIPDCPIARAEHLKSFAYFNDMSMVGTGPLPASAWLPEPRHNRDIARLAEALKTRQTKTLASGIDLIMADLRDSMSAPPRDISGHKNCLVFLVEYNRDPRADEAGSDWILDAQAQRAALLGAETATVLANYIRLLGFDARAHTETSTEFDLGQLAVAAGLCTVESGKASAPWLGTRFGIAAVSTDMPLAHDKPLAPWADQATFAPGWWLGLGHAKSALNRDPYAKRDYVMGAHPFERLKRVEDPTTYIDEARVARVPKRTDMFARAQFGDMGKSLQNVAKGGYYVRKTAPSSAQRRALGAFVLLQDGESAAGPKPRDAARNAANIKAASYFLSADAVGLSRCPDWTWYSHDATGEAIVPQHDQAISMIIDQGYSTTEGSSGDDWIAVAQSMRAYLRFSLLGGVIAQHIRNLGYKAKAHTVMDGEVLQPPLLLLAGLGEVSRIGEVILNPYLGPRLKSGVITTDMPMDHDKPIDFGLQAFCEACNKCARECPSGAITAGPKLMFNGYEIWKSDSQKCTTYRVTTKGGAMCGRCMKTCPWNLEGLFAEAPFRWAASNIPKLAKPLAKLDDMLGNGGLNDVKKWWWDIELQEDGSYRPTSHEVNRRDLQRDLDLKYEDQTLAVYPAPLAPHPYPYPFPMDREAGIKAYEALVTAGTYKKRIAAGDMSVVHSYTNDTASPVMRLTLTKAEAMTADVTKYEFSTDDGTPLPAWSAGAHLDILVSPEFLRQYSMSGDPADRSKYQIGVLREDAGRGGSALMHRIFTEGRKVFVSYPINHFHLDETATKTYLMGGGIGVTPMIAFAHRLHALGRDFALHYSSASRASAGYLDDLAAMPWADKVHYHFSDEGSRADLDAILAGYSSGAHVYTCGPTRYMDGVIEAATRQGFPEEAQHLEYFSVPEQPDYVNHAFTLKLKDGRLLEVPADKLATDVLTENGIAIDVKCTDGLCGVCKCGLVAGEVEHRDFVLSAKQRESEVILCQSRAAKAGGVIEIDL